jgi:hypothetical protein
MVLRLMPVALPLRVLVFEGAISCPHYAACLPVSPPYRRIDASAHALRHLTSACQPASDIPPHSRTSPHTVTRLAATSPHTDTPDTPLTPHPH